MSISNGREKFQRGMGIVIPWTFSLCLLALGILVSIHVMASSAHANEGDMPRCMPDQELLTEIKKRRQELEQRQQILQKKEEDIAVREKVLKEEMKKLEDLRSAMTAQQLVNSAKTEERVAKLVETMQTMSPKASAKLMAEIEEDLAVEAMSRMATPKLAKILNLIEPQKASILSEKLAGREGRRSTRQPSSKNSDDASDSSKSRTEKEKKDQNEKENSASVEGKGEQSLIDKKKTSGLQPETKSDSKTDSKKKTEVKEGEGNADTART